MFKNFFGQIIRAVATLVIALVVLGVVGLVIGRFSSRSGSSATNYPGQTEFEAANALINTSSKGLAHGNSPEAIAASSTFGASMKRLQAASFSGGSGRSFATGGDFLTYVKRTPNAVVILSHVPELRNYKTKETRAALAELAWAAGKSAAATIPGVQGSDTLIIGLRGVAFYGPIWQGTVAGEATRKTDDLEEKKRLYTFFVAAVKGAEKAPPSPAKATAP